MSNKASNEEFYSLAQRRFAEKKKFYKHLAIFAGVSLLFVFIWLITGVGLSWFVKLLALWGLGIIAHFLGIFVFPDGLAGDWMKRRLELERRQVEWGKKQSEWERRQIEKELRKLEKQL